MEREIVADVKRFCGDAWYGRRPELRHFSLEMLRDSDRTQAARSSGSFRIDSLVMA